MSRLWRWIVPALGVALTLGIAHASGPIGVYAVISKVVLEPNEQNPERIQVWGAFSLLASRDWSCATYEVCEAAKAKMAQPDAYQAPQSGYLYYKLPFPPGEPTSDYKRRMLAEWNDLKSVAGTHQLAGFGNALTPPKVRKVDQPPQNPDVYDFGRDLPSGTAGVMKLRSDTDFPPFQALLKFHEPGSH